MAASDVSIANGALIRLGVGSNAHISALTENSVNARAINAAYEAVRRALLRQFDWGFAIARVSVGADGSQTVWGTHNKYALPADFLRFILDDESGVRVDWRIEGRFIITDDASPLLFRYIQDQTDPNYFDTLFVEAFELKLAAKICKVVTGSNDLRRDLLAEYDDVVEKAKQVGSIEKPAQTEPDDDYITARY